jgi:subtilisin family serine protease
MMSKIQAFVSANVKLVGRRLVAVAPLLGALALLQSVLFGAVFTTYAAPPDPEGNGFQIEALPPEAERMVPVPPPGRGGVKNPKLDTALAEVSAAAAESVARALDLAAGRSMPLEGNRLLVQITVGPGAAKEVARLVRGHGGEVTGRSLAGDVLQAWVPIGALQPVAAERGVLFIRQPEPPTLFENVGAGSFNTEALSVMNADAWHSAGYDGTGVKVGVVDAGFQGYISLLGTELPASVTAKNFVDFESDAQVDGTTVHGTGCAEIVHDIAPGAELFLVKVGTNIDLQEAVIWLRDTQGVDVITTSLGWYNVTPGDGTGFFADLVSSARTAGIFWSTAAGNDRQAHWGGSYEEGGGGYHDFDGSGQVLNYYGPGDGDAYLIPEGTPIRVYLRWDDWAIVDQDYDLHLYQWEDPTEDWREVASSLDPQDGSPGQMPTERISYTALDEYGVNDGYGVYAIVIERFYSDRNVNLELFAPKVDRLDEIVTPRSLANLADAPDAVTVAALDVSSPYPQEDYSSEGPTNGPGGTAGGGAMKPDISGFARVSTESYGAGGFSGTSAATPHVAGAAALVLDACPTCTADQVEAFLDERAVDMGPAGLDSQFGYGRLHLGNAPAFLDVAPNHWAFDWIEALYDSGITSGCSSEPMMYCPEDTVTRAQMAIFLERGMRGSGYSPGPADGDVFDDVAADHWAAAWIEQLAADNITAGCSTAPPLYCPEDPVTRAQMAVFLERAGHWPDAYSPPAGSGAIFEDVSGSHWAADWIEQLYADGITSGCSSDPLMYCPEDSVTRSQMAVFIVRTFDLPMP